MRSRIIWREHGLDSRGRLSLQVCAIIAYSLGQTTLGEQIGPPAVGLWTAFAGIGFCTVARTISPWQNHFTLAKQL